MAKNMNLTAEINLALNEYVQEVQDAANESAKEAASATAQTLKTSSPKRAKGRGKGKYAKGWKVKKRKESTLVSYIVYNGASPGLTHVLEHGHLVSNQYGSYGRAKAIPHIGPAAETGMQLFESSVKRRLK